MLADKNEQKMGEEWWRRRGRTARVCLGSIWGLKGEERGTHALCVGASHVRERSSCVLLFGKMTKGEKGERLLHPGKKRAERKRLD
jgi:hypothetical protein